MSLPLLSSGAQCRHASTEWPGLDWFWWQNAWGHKLELHGLAGIHPSIHPSYFLASFLLQKQYETVFMSIFLFPNEIQWYRRASGPTRRGCSSQILQSAWKFSATWVCSKVLYKYIYTLYSTTFIFERLPQAKKTAQDWRICYISVSLQNGDSYDPRCVWPCQQHQSFISCSPNGLHLIIHCKHLTTRMILLGTPCGFRQTSCNMLVL